VETHSIITSRGLWTLLLSLVPALPPYGLASGPRRAFWRGGEPWVMVPRLRADAHMAWELSAGGRKRRRRRRPVDGVANQWRVGEVTIRMG
jgi:hypothetical protein